MNIKTDWSLVFVAIIVSVIGIVTLYGGGGVGEAQAYRKIIWLFLGITAMFLFRYLNYQLLGSYSALIYAISIFILLLTLVPFIGTEVKGARSWIRWGGIGFQPTELAKYSLVILLSKYLILREADVEKLRELIIPFILTAIPVILIGVQPDLGYAILFLPILFFMLFIGGANISILLGLFLVGFSLFFIPMYLEYHKFIIIEDMHQILKEVNFKLADAMNILSFDLWKYVDAETVSGIASKRDSLHQWAVKIVTSEENRKLIQSTAAKLFQEKPALLRDFLSSKLSIIIATSISILIYIGLTVLIFLSRVNWVKSIANLFLSLSISLGAYVISTYFIHFKTHQVVRIVSFANPEKFQKGAGYQLRHSLITLGSGRLKGKGVLAGDMTKGDIPFLPEWYNDFIFSVVGEQLGFWGASLALLLLFIIIIRGTIISLQSKDEFGSLLASGITIIFFLHVTINIGIAVGLFPVTGIPLIFISSGGSNMITSFMALGILLNINARRFINV